MLHRQHLFLDRLDHRQIAVDDEIEDGVKHIVDAVHQQGGRCLQLLAQGFMGAGGDVANTDDVMAADEHRGLAIGDLFAFEMGGAGDDEQLVAIDVELGKLVGLERVLDRQRMEVVLLLQEVQLGVGRVGDADPDELGLVLGARDLLVDRHLANALAVTIEKGGDDAHAAFVRWVEAVIAGMGNRVSCYGKCCPSSTLRQGRSYHVRRSGALRVG